MVSETTLGTFTVVKDERECENCPAKLDFIEEYKTQVVLTAVRRKDIRG